jgi:WD40 repeat protein
MTEQGTFGRYEIIGELGRGGMGTVYRAYDPNFDRDVALKVLPPQFMNDSDFHRRFEREARTIAALEHPAIVPVYDFGQEDSQPFLVMRFMDGGTLYGRIQKGSLSIEETLVILERIGPALDEAHEKGIVHRDIKPENILFDKRGDAHLSDFGLVKITSMTDSMSFAMVLGTPAYMSPEQVHSDEELGPRSDIYSLGVTLFEMLTGQVPYYDKVPTKIMMKHVMHPVPDILSVKPNLPQGCANIIARAMAKDPGQRYASVGEMTAALSSVAKGEPTPADDTVVQARGAGRQILSRFPTRPPEGKTSVSASIQAALVSTLKGHTDTVWSVAWSPNGQVLASASSDNSVILWNAQTGERARALKYDDRLHAVAWSHSGAMLACGAGDGKVVVWEAKSDGHLFTLEGHKDEAHSVAWSPDDARLVSASDDNTLMLWDVETSELLAKLEGHSRRVRSVAWSPDGALLVSGAADRRVIVWDAFTGAQVTTLEGHTFRVNDVAWSPDSTRLVSGSFDGALIVWEAGVWTPLGRLEGHADSIHSVSWSSDGLFLASGAHDHSVTVWDAETGEQLATLTEHSEAVRGVAWSPSPDGPGSAILASSSDDHAVLVWKL